jgi:hypothetical protein
MTRLARSFGVAALVAGACLVSACASLKTERYAHARDSSMHCKTGSRICREVDRTGRTRSPHPVATIQVNGELNGSDVASVLSKLPFVY